MASISEEEKILEAAVAGIPRVAEVVASIPEEERPRALDAVQRSYRQTVCNLGYGEGPLKLTRFRGHPKSLEFSEFTMARKHPPYAPEFRRQMIELVRAGCTPEELAKEFEPSAQAIRNWGRTGRP